MRPFVRVVVCGSIMAAGCTSAPRRVAVSELWAATARRDEVVVTSGILTVSSPSGCNDTDLSDGATRVIVEVDSRICPRVRAANGRRVRLEGTVSVAAAMPDVNLRPDASGCEPLLIFNATRVDPSP